MNKLYLDASDVIHTSEYTVCGLHLIFLLTSFCFALIRDHINLLLWSQIPYKIAVKFTGKCVCPVLLFNKIWNSNFFKYRLLYRCFPESFKRFSGRSFYKHLEKAAFEEKDLSLESLFVMLIILL